MVATQAHIILQLHAEVYPIAHLSPLIICNIHGFVWAPHPTARPYLPYQAYGESYLQFPQSYDRLFFFSDFCSIRRTA